MLARIEDQGCDTVALADHCTGGHETEPLIAVSAAATTTTTLRLQTAVQRPYPPLLIGGGGPKMLALAAQQADLVGVNASLLLDGNADVVAARAGR